MSWVGILRLAGDRGRPSGRARLVRAVLPVHFEHHAVVPSLSLSTRGLIRSPRFSLTPPSLSLSPSQPPPPTDPPALPTPLPSSGTAHPARARRGDASLGPGRHQGKQVVGRNARMRRLTQFSRRAFRNHIALSVLTEPKQKAMMMTECQAADAVVLTYACYRHATLEQLNSVCLPEIRLLQSICLGDVVDAALLHLVLRLEDVVAGHERGVCRMKTGDEAVFMLPHLAVPKAQTRSLAM